MTPRIVVAHLPDNLTLSEAKQQLLKINYSRIVVIRENIDKIVGTVLKNDLLIALIQGQENAVVGDFSRPSMIVKSSERADNLLLRFQHKLGRGPAAAVLYYGLMLAPASGIFNFYFQRYSYVADHLQYLACVGILTLIAAGAERLVRRGGRDRTSAWKVAMTAVILVLAVHSAVQQFTYTNLKTLWVSTSAGQFGGVAHAVNIGIGSAHLRIDDNAVPDI